MAKDFETQDRPSGRPSETEIRMALDAKAHEVDVPVDLASRTIELARERAKP